MTTGDWWTQVAAAQLVSSTTTLTLRREATIAFSVLFGSRCAAGREDRRREFLVTFAQSAGAPQDVSRRNDTWRKSRLWLSRLLE